MLSFKWKLYRVLTYAQLAYSSILLVWFIWLMTKIAYPPRDPWIPAIVGLVILLMVINSIINIVFLTRNFPDKAFSGSRKATYILSIVINFITVSGLGVGVAAGFISEFDPHNPTEDNTGLVILTMLSLITIVNLFLLICQLGIGGRLKKNSISSLRSLIDSIGDPTQGLVN